MPVSVDPPLHHDGMPVTAPTCQLRHTVGGLEASLEVRVVNRGTVPLLGVGGLLARLCPAHAASTLTGMPTPLHLHRDY